jgi:hypothetical protein
VVANFDSICLVQRYLTTPVLVCLAAVKVVAKATPKVSLAIGKARRRSGELGVYDGAREISRNLYSRVSGAKD